MMAGANEPKTSLIEPMDDHNTRLVEYLHPADWTNPEPAAKYDLVAIGGGPAGLICAAIVASLGGKVALIEKHLLGGDCLIVGCVPSKCLIRSSRCAAEMRDATRFGVRAVDPEGLRQKALLLDLSVAAVVLEGSDPAELEQGQGNDSQATPSWSPSRLSKSFDTLPP